MIATGAPRQHRTPRPIIKWALVAAGLSVLIGSEVFLRRVPVTVINPARCSATLGSPGLLTEPFHCPLFTERDRGQPWVFSRSLSPAPTGATTDFTSLWGGPRHPARAASGFDGAALAGDLLVSILVAVAVVVGFVAIPNWASSRRR